MMPDTTLDLEINSFPRDTMKLFRSLRDVVAWGTQGTNVLVEHEKDLVLFAANAGLYGYAMLRVSDQPLFSLATTPQEVFASKDDILNVLRSHLAEAESCLPAMAAAEDGSAIAAESVGLSPLIWIQIAQLAWQIIKVIRNK